MQIDSNILFLELSAVILVLFSTHTKFIMLTSPDLGMTGEPCRSMHLCFSKVEDSIKLDFFSLIFKFRGEIGFYM